MAKRSATNRLIQKAPMNTTCQALVVTSSNPTPSTTSIIPRPGGRPGRAVSLPTLYNAAVLLLTISLLSQCVTTLADAITRIETLLLWSAMGVFECYASEQGTTPIETTYLIANVSQEGLDVKQKLCHACQSLSRR